MDSIKLWLLTAAVGILIAFGGFTSKTLMQMFLKKLDKLDVLDEMLAEMKKLNTTVEDHKAKLEELETRLKRLEGNA
jgi:predicted nuclease with TOPRIM domain